MRTDGGTAGTTTTRRARTPIALCIALLGLCALPAVALGHVERSAYWPDPAPDCSVTPCAGGAVPTARSLASALDASEPGTTRVVCQDDSLARLNASVEDALVHGYDIRPTDHRSLSAEQATDLTDINQQLFALCSYDEIQPAITASGNNDRVVIMPGLYTEPTARAAKTNDPACDQYKVLNEHGSSGLSYASQYYCPNDQNLIAVMGQAPGAGKDPQPPLENRRGIPNTGPCVRCNLQVEGSGVSADDVVIDGGRVESGNHGPIEAKKDVGIRVDRADGFVLRNVLVRHVNEHAIYVLETDGYQLDRFKTFYGADYGVLTFVEDHGLIQNCEAAGSGDSGLYPGAGADTGAQRAPGTAFRYSQQLRFCDSHHNASGYSGTDGNATHIDHNNFYDNALGFTTDVFTAPGHPGFPQDSDLVEDNNFYSNNFNPYGDRSDVDPTVPVPVGTGLWIAGGNNNVVRNNHFWNNWRRGVMLFSAPDVFICGPVIGSPVTGCDPLKVSTSYDNRFYGNVMGLTPGGTTQPNGTDFWWDSFPGNTGNCWYGNKAAPGKSVTTSHVLPGCLGGTHPETSIGTSDPINEAELTLCLAAISTTYNQPTPICSWFDTPPKPGSAGALAGVVKTARLRGPTRTMVADLRVGSLVCRLYGSSAGAGCDEAAAPQVPVSIRSADCGDWLRAGSAQRSALLAHLRGFYSGPISEGTVDTPGPTLSRSRAAQVFQHWCELPFSSGFKLYKLYGRAVAFSSVASR